MPIKVLVVDDSSFFRRRVSEILNAHPRLEVIGSAVNGQEAIEQTKLLQPDVITMDIEMPVLDGISAVKEIMKSNPTPILMFSSLTQDGAKATLDALDAGALDFLPKKFEDIARNKDEAISLLQNRVEEISRKRILMASRSFQSSLVTLPQSASTSNPAIGRGIQQTFKASGKQHQLLAIGASTGGPVALQKVLTALPADFPAPILIIQHMPASFTGAFAKRLDTLSKISVKEAEDGEVLFPGNAYLAPGGFQMMIEGRPSMAKIKIIDGGERINYKPSVDITFGSLANVYHEAVLSVVLTGMGTDGREGARLLKEQGATVWSQDEASCVVYGMPQAVEKAGLSSEVLPLEKMAARILSEFKLG